MLIVQKVESVAKLADRADNVSGGCAHRCLVQRRFYLAMATCLESALMPFELSHLTIFILLLFFFCVNDVALRSCPSARFHLSQLYQRFRS
jgi:hypothetical protein